MYILYNFIIIWRAENHSPIFFCEEGSGKYGWLYGILGWLRVKYPNVHAIGKSTYLLRSWYNGAKYHIHNLVWVFGSRDCLCLYCRGVSFKESFFEAKGTCQWWLERTPESSKSQGSNDSINKFKLVFPSVVGHWSLHRRIMDLPFLSETSVDELNFQLQIDETFKAFMFKTVSRPKLKLLFRCTPANPMVWGI